MRSLAQVIDEHAQRRPDAPAFLGRPDDARSCVSYGEYSRRSNRLAAALVTLGVARGERVAVLLPDGPGVHVAFVACEKAGATVMGIGPRAGSEELRHLLAKSGASVLLSRPSYRDDDTRELFATLRSGGLPLRHHVVLPGEAAEDEPITIDGREVRTGSPAQQRGRLVGRGFGPKDLFLLNSTSGTTGMPKCVVHDQSRWFYFHELAIDSGELTSTDVFMSLIPASFGFGIWTAHVTPALLGAPTVLVPKFDAGEAIALIEAHRVSVLAAVSTQFIMMLGAPELLTRELGSLRVLYTGGEAVPAQRAARFEEITGAQVLQFYGSNETGALSRTTTRDSQRVRFETAGHVIEDMQVRLFDEQGRDVTDSGRGQPGCKGPALSLGYWNDETANRELLREDGWMMTGDVATIDDDGVLSVVGRVQDFIIRGGKNVSGPAVEAAVATHPDVLVAAAVGMPDEDFGERICAYVELRADARLELSELTEHLASNGVSRETFPERLIVLDSLPRSSGGKVAKQQLREDIAKRVAQDVAQRAAQDNTEEIPA